jgi:hypothetical protein
LKVAIRRNNNPRNLLDGLHEYPGDFIWVGEGIEDVFEVIEALVTAFGVLLAEGAPIAVGVRYVLHTWYQW